MNYIFIRHGETEGNLLGKFIGSRTDEPLSEEGKRFLTAHFYPQADIVYTSPMLRCLETADIIYPNMKKNIIPDFRECDFGDFENLSHKELNGRNDYQFWIDSNGEAPFPGGESKSDFSERSVRAFSGIRLPTSRQTAAIIAHGGTIMAILERYGTPKRSYYDYRTSNGNGYLLLEDGRYSLLFP